MQKLPMKTREKGEEMKLGFGRVLQRSEWIGCKEESKSSKRTRVEKSLRKENTNENNEIKKEEKGRKAVRGDGEKAGSL